MDQHVVGWIEDNKGERSVDAIAVAAPRHRSIQSCVTILHHSGCDMAGQRTRPGAAYIAPRGLAAIGEPPQNEMLLSRPAGPARPRWETGTLDIRKETQAAPRRAPLDATVAEEPRDA
jgi:hypothetical protein